MLTGASPVQCLRRVLPVPGRPWPSLGLYTPGVRYPPGPGWVGAGSQFAGGSQFPLSKVKLRMVPDWTLIWATIWTLP